MEPVRSSLGGGVAATVALGIILSIADALLGGTSLFVLATFTSLCSIGGPPYCELGTPQATLLTLVVLVGLFTLAWPLFFAGFTWGLPGESGIVHGLVFGLVVWSGYAVVLWIGVWLGWETLAAGGPIAAVLLLAYAVYGVVLGGVYDYLAEHRTLLVTESA
ncbi:DUF6789 family protein [Haloarcula nitratireducens]|uniref:Uncharacterized protein n=1 Tax=Haloarcula nitratireducens TaxID=2487749 RepID=A0AAW4PF68_9EURY|nr:DUF6789 family protein [Halomicroarcula nitratireducens]MBX0295955.1 hypothetical protein [Halomicroarcula nitratireducens]